MSFAITPEKQVKLQKYVDLLLKWNSKINLIAKSTIPDVWQRHIQDSLQVAEKIPADTRTLIDLGSGGGLPAIPLAIATGLPVHMIESDKRKSVFLRQALRELALEGKVHDCRIDEANLTNVQEPVIITARALSDLQNICEWTNSLVAKNNLNHYALLLLKGENVSRETLAAKQSWELDSEVFESKTSNGSVILKIKNFTTKN